MNETQKPSFDPKVFLATVEAGRTISKYHQNQSVFAQGDPGDAVFFVQEGGQGHGRLGAGERGRHRDAWPKCAGSGSACASSSGSSDAR
jgi:hypothetical protein